MSGKGDGVKWIREDRPVRGNRGALDSRGEKALAKVLALFAVCLGVVAVSTSPALAAPVPGSFSITGTVTDSSAEPLADICVYAYNSNGTEVGNTRTNSNGEYILFELDTGNYRVSFSDCSFNTSNNVLDEYYNNQASLASATPIPVLAGSETSGINAQLVTASSISGTVTNGSGTPLSSICVVAYDSNLNRLGQFTNTDANGHYRIKGLRAGSYRVHFTDCGAASHDVFDEYFDDKSSLESATPILVSEGAETSGIDVEMTGFSSVSGTVTNNSNAPLGNICIHAYDSDGDDAGSFRTRANGNYTVGGLSQGNYRLYFEDCSARFSNNVLNEYFDDKQSLAAATPIPVTAGADTSGIDAQLATAGSISGTVTNSSSKPLKNIVIGIFDTKGNDLNRRYRVVTDAEGRFIVEGLPTGSYRVLFAGGFPFAVGEFYDNKSSLAAATRIPVSAGSVTPGIDARLVPYSAKIGKVVVKGPRKGKKGKTAMFRVKIRSSGTLIADGVKLTVRGKGVRLRMPLGDLPNDMTFRFKVKVRLRKVGKVKLRFRVSSENARGKTVRKTITVRK